MDVTVSLVGVMASGILNTTALLASAADTQGVVGDAALVCSRKIKEVMRNITEPWAARMVDATAKLPEPLQGGLLTHLGDFDGCLSVRAAPAAPPLARYCLAQLRVPGTLLAGAGAGAEAVAVEVPLRVGLCVPAACADAALDEVLRAASRGVAGVPAGACQAADDPTRADAATVVLGCVVGLAVVLAFSSWLLGSLQCLRLPDGFRAAAKAFSPVTAWRSLSGPPGAGPLATVSGIRVVTIAWVVLGHRVMMQTSLPLLDLKEVPYRLKSWHYAFIPAGLFAVDTFLTVAGIVLSYTFLSRPPAKFHLPQIGKYYLHRYVRLTPLLAFVVLLYAGALPVMGTGPLWPQQESAQSEPCRSNWWPTLLYIHNYYNNRNMCVGHAWYLAVDFHLYLLSPLLLVPLWKRPRAGRWLLGGVLAASVAVPFAIVMARHLIALPNPFGDPQAHLAHTEGVYIPTHARAAPWLVGLWLGTWLSSARTPSMQARTAALVWGAAALCLIGPCVATTAILRQGDADTPTWEAAVFVACSKPVWAMGVCGVIAACACGYGGPVSALLSWRPLATLGRITYGVYLLHPLVQAACSWPARTPTVSEDFVTWPLAVSDLVITFAISLPVSLLIESPFIALERMLLRPKKKQPDGVSASTSASASAAGPSGDAKFAPSGSAGAPTYQRPSHEMAAPPRTAELMEIMAREKIVSVHRSDVLDIHPADSVSLQVFPGKQFSINEGSAHYDVSSGDSSGNHSRPTSGHSALSAPSPHWAPSRHSDQRHFSDDVIFHMSSQESGN